MKHFDWTESERRHRPEHVAWLKAHHDKPTSEAEFIAAYRRLRGEDARPHKARRYATTKLRQQYRHLRDTFGFFV